MFPVFLVPAVLAYLFLALAALIDKILLKTTIVSPRAYAFFVGILSVGVLVLLPFGVVSVPTGRVILASLASGVCGVYALWAFYSALKEHEASRVVTAVGALVPIFTLLLSIVILNEGLNALQFIAFVLLVVGGAIISYRENVKRAYTFEILAHAARASAFFAVSFTLLRFVFIFEPFLNGFFWTRIGGILGALTILAVPENLKRIYWAAKKAPKRAPVVFVLNQGLGGAGAILQNYAIFLGSAALVGALQGVQYAFLLVLIVFLSKRFPQLKEQLGLREWSLKIFAIAVVGIGLYLISIS
ncbi:EamA family transporter [Candidatus Saccharibacteria bacterium]|nr:EamA family transporter [Candidatus Saccharibacteria bacterium]